MEAAEPAAITTVVHPLTTNITPSTGGTNTCETIQLTPSVQNFETFTVIPDSARWSANDTTAISVQGRLSARHLAAPPVPNAACNPGVILSAFPL